MKLGPSSLELLFLLDMNKHKNVNIDFDKPLIFNTFFTVLYQPRLFLANICLFRPFCFFIGFFFTPNTGLLGGFGRFGNFALAVFIMELIHLS